jgi:hypothetical protein
MQHCRRCTKCSEEKVVEEFRIVDSDTRYHPWCRACENAATKGSAARLRNKAVIKEYKNCPCFDCHVQYPWYVMTFDHRDPSQKLFNLSAAGARPLQVVLDELAKCDPVCGNCHLERTHAMLNDPVWKAQWHAKVVESAKRRRKQKCPPTSESTQASQNSAPSTEAIDVT